MSKTINVPEQWNKKDESEYFETFFSSLPKDSYLYITLKGIEKVVQDNICNDFARNPVEEIDSLYTELTGLKRGLRETEEAWKLSQKTLEEANLSHEQLRQALQEKIDAKEELVQEITSDLKDCQVILAERNFEINNYEQTIIELKAKLYDLICK